MHFVFLSASTSAVAVYYAPRKISISKEDHVSDRVNNDKILMYSLQLSEMDIYERRKYIKIYIQFEIKFCLFFFYQNIFSLQQQFLQCC